MFSVFSAIEDPFNRRNLKLMVRFIDYSHQAFKHVGKENLTFKKRYYNKNCPIFLHLICSYLKAQHKVFGIY